LVVSALHDAPPPLVGGRYALGDLIGRGGAAEVFRARDELLGRDVAIKMFTAGGDTPTEVLDAPAGVDPKADPADAAAAAAIGDLENGQEARHRREVLTLAGLSHPGLVTVYDVGDQDGRAYFVMQLIEGDTLGQRIRYGPMHVVDVVALGAALADALAYVHRRGVVHRDVKPGNVLLDADGRAHLSDFGIAAVRDAAPVTGAGMVIGTASYLSPEQVRGEPVGTGVDVYALGLVLLESLTGRREYPGAALEAAVARLHRRPYVPSELPEPLAVLLTAMTEDDPDARPNAEEVVLRMRDVSREIGLDAETVLSPVLMTDPTDVVGPLARGAAVSTGAREGAAPDLPVTGASLAARPGRVARHRTMLLVIGMVVALAAAGTAVASTLFSPSPAPPPPAPTVASAPPLPPAPPVVAPTPQTEAERATATRSRRPRVTPTPTPTPIRTRTRVPVPAVPAAPSVVVPPREPAPTPTETRSTSTTPTA